jgi:hypothetical protein
MKNGSLDNQYLVIQVVTMSFIGNSNPSFINKRIPKRNFSGSSNGSGISVRSAEGLIEEILSTTISLDSPSILKLPSSVLTILGAWSKPPRLLTKHIGSS